MLVVFRKKKALRSERLCFETTNVVILSEAKDPCNLRPIVPFKGVR